MLLKCLYKKGSKAPSETMKLTSITRDPTVWYENQGNEAEEYDSLRHDEKVAEEYDSLRRDE